jgi:putative SOS response-associated peptidase YedK
MCGRFTQTSAMGEMAQHFGLLPPYPNAPAHYNAAPTQDLLTVLINPKTEQRRLVPLRWGLIPYWAKDADIGYRTINAKAESIDTRPAFRAKRSGSAAASCRRTASTSGRRRAPRSSPIS